MLTFGPKGELTIEDSNNNSSSGPTYSSAGNQINFDGSTSMNGLSVGGSWKLTWVIANECKAIDGDGKNLTLHRVGN